MRKSRKPEKGSLSSDKANEEKRKVREGANKALARRDSKNKGKAAPAEPARRRNNDEWTQ